MPNVWVCVEGVSVINGIYKWLETNVPKPIIKTKYVACSILEYIGTLQFVVDGFELVKKCLQKLNYIAK